MMFNRLKSNCRCSLLELVTFRIIIFVFKDLKANVRTCYFFKMQHTCLRISLHLHRARSLKLDSQILPKPHYVLNNYISRSTPCLCIALFKIKVTKVL